MRILAASGRQPMAHERDADPILFTRVLACATFRIVPRWLWLTAGLVFCLCVAIRIATFVLNAAPFTAVIFLAGMSAWTMRLKVRASARGRNMLLNDFDEIESGVLRANEAAWNITEWAVPLFLAGAAVGASWEIQEASNEHLADPMSHVMAAYCFIALVLSLFGSAATFAILLAIKALTSRFQAKFAECAVEAGLDLETGPGDGN
jgi:uncharacterized membrane protein (UPF0182 family)